MGDVISPDGLEMMEIGPEDKDEREAEGTDEGTETRTATDGDTDEGTDEADTDGEAEETPEEPPRRFGSWDEAERAHLEAQRAMTRKAQEAAEYRRKLEAFERQKAEADAREKAETDLEAWQAERYAKAMRDVERLDPDAEDFREQEARILARYNREYRAQERELMAAATPPAAETGMEAGPEPEPADTAEAQAAEIEAARSTVNRLMTAEKIEPTDPVFGYYAQRVQDVDAEGRPRTLEDQVAEAIQETKKHYANQRAKIQGETAQPMGRQGAGKPKPAKPEPVKPMSLGEAIRNGRRKRAAQ